MNGINNCPPMPYPILATPTMHMATVPCKQIKPRKSNFIQTLIKIKKLTKATSSSRDVCVYIFNSENLEKLHENMAEI